MGIAAYNRGTKLLRERLDRESTGRPGRIGSVVHPPAEPSDPIPTVKPWTVGEKAYCIVHGAEGWYTVTAVKGDRIKIHSCRSWCPTHNFNREGR